MSRTNSEAAALSDTDVGTPARPGWLAAGGLIGAVLASSCCLLPLALVTLGVSGAWIVNLTALEPYKPYIAGAALVPIGLGFRQVYFKAAPACAIGGYCASPRSALVTKTTLWLASAMVLLSLTVNLWAPLFY